MIANHKNPASIDGCASCPSGDLKKLKFSTGWIVVYQMVESEIHFLFFYKDHGGR